MQAKGFVIVLGGVGLAALIRFRSASDRRLLAQLQGALDALESKTNNQAAMHAAHLNRIESRIQAHETRLRDVRSNAEMAAIVEELVAASMTRIDQRFSSYHQSVEELRSAVVRSQKLMEAVLVNLRCMTANRVLAGTESLSPFPSERDW